MANTIRIKRRAAGGASGAPNSLANAELAFNEQDVVLYYGFGTGGGGGSATSVIPIGGSGAFVTLSTNSTITGVKTFTNTISGSIDGNSATTTKWATARNLNLTGDVTGTFNSVDGSAAVNAAITLATVNNNTGSFTKVTVNEKGLVTAAVNATLNDINAPTSSFSFNSQNLTNLANPVNGQDAATKTYVDNVAQGLDAKQSVKCGTTANITLSGLQTIDGITVSANDRVLVKNQSTASQNGIYLANASSWSRATDMDSWLEVPNSFVFVEEGTTLADTSWVCTSNAGGTLESTSIAWVQFGSASSYSAGNGLQLVGNTFSVVANGTTIDVSASGIKVSDTYAGNSSLATVGTVTTGTWNGSVISGTYGGTGVNNGNNTITVGGNLSTVGSFSTNGVGNLTVTTTANTAVILPTSGTLVNTAVTSLSSLATVGTITSGTWNGSTIGVAYGGTGVTSFTSKGIIYGNTTGALQVTAAGTWDATAGVGQLLSVNSAGTPTWTDIIDGGTF